MEKHYIELPSPTELYYHSNGDKEPIRVKGYTREQVIAAIEADRQRRGEPVAWRTYDRNGWYVISPTLAEAERDFPGKDHQPLYAIPQPAEPVDPDFMANLKRSRAKYPGNARMFDGLMGELDELRRAYAGDGDIRSEAFDVAVCAYRIATEGDVGGNSRLTQPAAGFRRVGEIRLDANRHPYACLLTGYDENGDQWKESTPIYAATQPAEPVGQHPDDAAVDAFAASMKAKLAKKRAEGRDGWRMCSAGYLSRLLREHVEKGDPVDVANLAMMLSQNGQRIEATEPVKAWVPEKCPITNRPFFMWIEHHETGEMVPTYGGPYDSYTLPERDADGFVCERYDHDEGRWVTECVESVGLKLVGDQSFVVDVENPRYEEIEAFASAEPVKVPSDDALVDALINLEYDNYEQSFSGYKNRQADIALIRAAIEAERKRSGEPVAYLDLGVGGYMDLGTDLTDEQLAALPKGRHMLAIVGTYGVDGYTKADPQPADPNKWKQTVDDELTSIDSTADSFPSAKEAASTCDCGQGQVCEVCDPFLPPSVPESLASMPSDAMTLDGLVNDIENASAAYNGQPMDRGEAEAIARALLARYGQPAHPVKIDVDALAQERADFEAWMRKEHPDHSLEYVNGRYTYSPPQRLWEAYQTGRTALQSQDRDDALMESLQMMVYMVEQSAPQLKGKVYEHALAAIDHARRADGAGE